MKVFITTEEDYRQFLTGAPITCSNVKPKQYFRSILIMLQEIEVRLGDALLIRKKI